MNAQQALADGKDAYDSLSDANREIRLFQLAPGSGEEVVFGELLHTSIAAIQREPALTFEALSYAWGDPTDTDPILCRLRPTATSENVWQPVTKNLHAALRQLRLPSRPRLLWIDALCINQSDVCERNSQVRHMAEIYSSANDVLVWLGKDLGYDPFEGVRLGLEELNRCLYANAYHGFSQDTSGAALRALPLLARSWFRRKWIIQEVILAKNVILHCGSFSLPLDQLQTYVINEFHWSVFRPTHAIFARTPDFQAMLDAATGLSNLLFIARCRNRLSDMRLANILLETRQFECTDPRDFVFSILSIAADVKADSSAGLRADYSLPLATVVTMVTEWLTTHDGLDILSQVTGDDWLSNVGQGTASSSWSAGGLLQAVNMGRDDLINPLTRSSSLKEPNWRLWGKQEPANSPALRVSFDGKLNLSGIPADRLCFNPASFFQPNSSTKATFKIATYRKVESEYIMERLRRWWSLTVDDHSARHGPGAPQEQLRRRFSRLVFLVDLVDYSSDSTFRRCAGLEWESILLSYWNYLVSEANQITTTEGAALKHAFGRTNKLDKTVRTQVITREFCITKKGRLALVPPTARDGDLVYVTASTQSPYLLRPYAEKQFSLIGEAYVEELMAKQDQNWDFRACEQITII